MRAGTSPSSGKSYGLALVCRIWRVARATVYRHRVPADPGPRRRPGPVGAMPDVGLLERIRGVLDASPFHGEGHRKVLSMGSEFSSLWSLAISPVRDGG